MRVVITGASGFLGSHFLQHYADHNVIGVDNVPGPGVHLADAGEFLRAYDEDVDLAFHFASPVGGREKIEGDPLYNADALRLDSEFFRWAVKHVKGTVIYPSSSAVYGALYQKDLAALPLMEDMFDPREWTWAAPDELYGLSKLVGENLAWKAEGYGLNTLCLRPFSGYGPGQKHEYPVTAICQRALDRENPLAIWGSGKQRRDFVHVSDIVQANLLALETDRQGYEVMNIGSGRATSFEQVAFMAARIVGYEPRLKVERYRPEGVLMRYADIRRMSRYWTAQVDLATGLASVLDWLSA